ncbi:transporter substrate-binding domain-containing protein [Pseudomonas entomophila]|uniref:ABC transporter substrate-binding protein n=1 Tax=Pseudomonas entomophila TaxID=312306 RepID=UPI0023D87D5E|nr:transporter substrate-binding domain-containing protein [Pseudomonas entomophila]MDF0732910.1 transporter substrate-binding domain-containing protein [Pseudomonas entomophila]
MSRATVLTLALSLCATAHATDGTLQPDRLSIGSDLTYPPYTYLDQGKPAGFDPEFMTVLGQHLKLEAQFQDTRFANLVMGVNARRFDVVASALYVTPERAAQVDFVPYLKSGASLLVRADDSFRPRRPEDLCGKRVGSIKGGSWIPKLVALSKSHCEANGQASIDSREFPTSPEAAQALLAKAVDVQFEDAAVAAITADKLKGRLLISSNELIYPVVIGLAVRKGNEALLGQLQQGFAAMKASGEYQALLSRYNLGEPSAAEVAVALGRTPQAAAQ